MREAQARVLLVDDDPVFTGAMSRGFVRRGYDVRTCHSASDALKECADWQPDCIVLDLNMPGTSGLLVLPELLHACPEARLVVGVIVNCTSAAAPAVPVAVNVTGDPVRPADVAVSEFAPAVVPSVQLVTVAMPLASVVTADVGTTVPPPVATANVTDTPDFGFPFASVTSTLGSVATAEPATADCPLPAFTAIVEATPAAMLKVLLVAPVRLVAEAVSV